MSTPTPAYRDVVVTEHFLRRMHERLSKWPDSLLTNLIMLSPLLGGFLDRNPGRSCYARACKDGPWVVFRPGRKGQVVLLTITITRPNGTYLDLDPIWS